ncbi:MAG: hypothetical protein JWL72_3653 [Ilumatobacteraceae bacterium]|nr:hypothetical protein [Ilumatobacteraceae bacterium]
MSNDQPSRRPPVKSTTGGAPMGSTISIVIAVVAVVVGFLILRNINNDGSSAGALPSGPGVSTPSELTTIPGLTDTTATTAAPAVVTPTTVPLVFSPGTVVVANASGVGGAAKTATKALTTAGWTMGDPTDAFGPAKRIDKTVVYYKPGGEQVAASVAQAFSTPTAVVVSAAMPAPIPVVNATIGDATVLVMLGTDLAGKALPLLAPPDTTIPATTLPTAAIGTSTSVP